MMVWTLFLAAVGFALLVVALITGSVLWAWICIAVCVAGAFVLLASVMWARPASGSDEPPRATAADPAEPAEPELADQELDDDLSEPVLDTSPAADDPPTDPAIPRYPEGPNEITQEIGPYPTRAERRRASRHRK